MNDRITEIAKKTNSLYDEYRRTSRRIIDGGDTISDDDLKEIAVIILKVDTNIDNIRDIIAGGDDEEIKEAIYQISDGRKSMEAIGLKQFIYHKESIWLEELKKIDRLKKKEG